MSYRLPSSYTFTPNKEEVIGSRFRLRYSTTCNSYYRDWSDAIDPSAQGVISRWDKVLYSVDSVHRHINEEVGQVYLERTPGSNTGCIKWRINFGCCGLLVDEVTIRLSCVEEYGGEVVVTLMGTPGEKRVRYPIGSDYVTYNELENSTELTLTVHFVGETGQVTRLFPQSILRGMGYPLDIQVILKPPLQSLGRPRMLVGLLYSSSQEIEVDGRHYKQNTTNTGQGFLHVHLLRAMDLPGGKHGLPETFSKCYLLPDAKKSTKCRTKSRKGKDPLWNEEFLIVGVNFHDVKRRALEICIADSHTSVGKKAKFLGGLRLSLGYKAVVAAQTKQVSNVLRLLKGKGGVSGGRNIETEGTRERKVSFSDKDTVIANVNSSFGKWKRASGKSVAKDNTDSDTKAEIDAGTAGAQANNNTGNVKITVDVTKPEIVENEQQSASSTSTEDMSAACDSAPDPTANSEQELGTSPDKDNADKRSPEERLFHSVLTSIKQLEIATRYSVTLESSEDKELELFKEHEKEDDRREVTNGPDNEDAKRDEKQESGENSPRNIVNDAKQEENGFKETETPRKGDLTEDKFVLHDNNNKVNEINEKHSQNEDDLEKHGVKEVEIQINGNLTDERIILNDIKGTEVISNVEVHENPPDSSENCRTEHDKNTDKQNGDETCTKVEEAIEEEKSTKKEISLQLSSAVTETRGSVKMVEGKIRSVSAPPRQEIKVDRLQIEHNKVHGASEKTSTDSNEMKRSPSFTFKDLGKKLNFRGRSKSESDKTGSEAAGLATNANKVMLDAEGLEITQWTLVVDRPKQWHYCWHILRPEMTILH
ncbi:uncharacterized protein LOC144660155 isoform X2 [Oculina patagonica]